MAVEKLCTNCHYVGKPRLITRGSFGIELALWLCFLAPGLIYSIWRLTSRYSACPSCGAPNMIPTNSPAAKKILNVSPAPEKPSAGAIKQPSTDEENGRPNVYVIKP